MAEDDGRRPGPDQRPEDVARVNLDACEAPAGKDLVEQDPVPDVDGDGPELLGGAVGEAGAHVSPDLRGSAKASAENRPVADCGSRQGDGLAKPAGFGRVNAGGSEFGFLGGAEGFEAAESQEESLRRGERDGQDVGEQLRGRKVGRFGVGCLRIGGGRFGRCGQLAIVDGFLRGVRDAQGERAGSLRRRTALLGGTRLAGGAGKAEVRSPATGLRRAQA